MPEYIFKSLKIIDVVTSFETWCNCDLSLQEMMASDHKNVTEILKCSTIATSEHRSFILIKIMVIRVITNIKPELLSKNS